MRTDLSSWLTHFIHRRNPENDPRACYEEIARIPIAHSESGKPIFTDWDYWDEEYPIAPDDYPFAVLKKILDDGHIRATWAYRRQKPTIYGPRAAVCLTEMPLYALIEYAQTRNQEDSVAKYGIALPKNELFIAGARPVIYGLSSDHKEAGSEDSFYQQGCRMLSDYCGIAPCEQYRYVAMNLDKDRHIDWSHEREWRWTKNFSNFPDIPGLSVWLKEESYNFSKILLIVQTKKEAEELLNNLKGFDDNPYTKYDLPISRKAVANTRVIALQELTEDFANNRNLRIEDIPTFRHKSISRREPSHNTLIAVKQAVEKARLAAIQVAQESPSNGLYGWAWVTTYDAQTEVTEALLKLGFARSYNTCGYRVEEVMRDVKTGSMIDTEEKAADAAARILNSELNQNFYRESRLD